MCPFFILHFRDKKNALPTDRGTDERTDPLIEIYEDASKNGTTYRPIE